MKLKELVHTVEEIKAAELIGKCEFCNGAGVVLAHPGRAVGVCWATPHGFPDDTEIPCEDCDGKGWRYLGGKYHPVDDYESIDDFLVDYEWHEKEQGYVRKSDRKEVETLW